MSTTMASPLRQSSQMVPIAKRCNSLQNGVDWRCGDADQLARNGHTGSLRITKDRIEYSKTGHSKCHICKVWIQEGELRIVREEQNPSKTSRFFHLNCWNPKVLIPDLFMIEGISQLQPSSKEKVKSHLLSLHRYHPRDWSPTSSEERRRSWQAELDLKKVSDLRKLWNGKGKSRLKKSQLIKSIINKKEKEEPWSEPMDIDIQPTRQTMNTSSATSGVSISTLTQPCLFDVLPVELLIHIFGFLTVGDFYRLIQTCSEMARLILEENMIWKHKYSEQWPQDYIKLRFVLKQRRQWLAQSKDNRSSLLLEDQRKPRDLKRKRSDNLRTVYQWKSEQEMESERPLLSAQLWILRAQIYEQVYGTPGSTSPPVLTRATIPPRHQTLDIPRSTTTQPALNQSAPALPVHTRSMGSSASGSPVISVRRNSYERLIPEQVVLPDMILEWLATRLPTSLHDLRVMGLGSSNVFRIYGQRFIECILKFVAENPDSFVSHQVPDIEEETGYSDDPSDISGSESPSMCESPVVGSPVLTRNSPSWRYPRNKESLEDMWRCEQEKPWREWYRRRHEAVSMPKRFMWSSKSKERLKKLADGVRVYRLTDGTLMTNTAMDGMQMNINGRSTLAQRRELLKKFGIEELKEICRISGVRLESVKGLYSENGRRETSMMATDEDVRLDKNDLVELLTRDSVLEQPEIVDRLLAVYERE